MRWREANTGFFLSFFFFLGGRWSGRGEGERGTTLYATNDLTVVYICMCICVYVTHSSIHPLTGRAALHRHTPDDRQVFGTCLFLSLVAMGRGRGVDGEVCANEEARKMSVCLSIGAVTSYETEHAIFTWHLHYTHEGGHWAKLFHDGWMTLCWLSYGVDDE